MNVVKIVRCSKSSVLNSRGRFVVEIKSANCKVTSSTCELSNKIKFNFFYPNLFYSILQYNILYYIKRIFLEIINRISNWLFLSIDGCVFVLFV